MMTSNERTGGVAMVAERLTRRSAARAFTLVELLVVVAVIALLIGILLPALASARASGQRIVIQNNLRQVTLGVTAYASVSASSRYPASYAYGSSVSGMNWSLDEQRGTITSAGREREGYVHWSYSLVGEEITAADAFASPATEGGGAPRTNPGADPQDWAPNQVNVLGQTAGQQASSGDAFPEDRQVPRLAYAGNHLVFPRNKFSTGDDRQNRFVGPHEIRNPSATILATEFNDEQSWSTLASADESGSTTAGFVIKSHRPLTPVYHIAAGAGDGVYTWSGRLVSDSSEESEYLYPRLQEVRDLVEGSVVSVAKRLDDGVRADLGVVKVDHPNRTTHFTYLDGHVAAKTLVEAVQGMEFGRKFFSVTGKDRNIVDPVLREEFGF